MMSNYGNGAAKPWHSHLPPLTASHLLSCPADTLFLAHLCWCLDFCSGFLGFWISSRPFSLPPVLHSSSLLCCLGASNFFFRFSIAHTYPASTVASNSLTLFRSLWISSSRSCFSFLMFASSSCSASKSLFLLSSSFLLFVFLCSSLSLSFLTFSHRSIVSLAIHLASAVQWTPSLSKCIVLNLQNSCSL